MTHHTLTSWGFVLAYCALMVGLIVQVMPFAAGYRVLIGCGLLLPVGLIGATMAIYGRFISKDDIWS